MTYMYSDLEERIQEAVNASSAENHSDTPDFVLAAYLIGCLRAFDLATNERDRWHGMGRGETRSDEAWEMEEEPKEKR